MDAKREEDELLRDYWKDREPETWEETFDEERDDIKAFGKRLSAGLKRFAWYLRDFVVIVTDLIIGTIVGGYAVDEMMDILFADFLLDEWLSPQTLSYLKKQANIFHGQRRPKQLMTQLSMSYSITKDYLTDRYLNFTRLFKPFRFGTKLI